MIQLNHSPTRLRELADAKEKKAQGKTGATYNNLMQQAQDLRLEADEIEGKK